jgi:hypothetical protein
MGEGVRTRLHAGADGEERVTDEERERLLFLQRLALGITGGLFGTATAVDVKPLVELVEQQRPPNHGGVHLCLPMSMTVH